MYKEGGDPPRLIDINGQRVGIPPKTPTPSAVERVGTNSKLILSILGIPESQVLGQGVPYHIHLRHSGSPREPAQQKSTKSRKWLDFGTNGTPEALDERNPYSATSRSHWEGSRTLERGPGPQKWRRSGGGGPPESGSKRPSFFDPGHNNGHISTNLRRQKLSMSESHWEGSRALERGPGPQKWGRRHGEAFK